MNTWKSHVQCTTLVYTFECMHAHTGTELPQSQFCMDPLTSSSTVCIAELFSDGAETSTHENGQGVYMQGEDLHGSTAADDAAASRPCDTQEAAVHIAVPLGTESETMTQNTNLLSLETTQNTGTSGLDQTQQTDTLSIEYERCGDDENDGELSSSASWDAQIEELERQIASLDVPLDDAMQPELDKAKTDIDTHTPVQLEDGMPPELDNAHTNHMQPDNAGDETLTQGHSLDIVDQYARSAAEPEDRVHSVYAALPLAAPSELVDSMRTAMQDIPQASFGFCIL